jgi:phosphoribosylformylglycinamidine cyclo-ligase
MSNSPAPTVSPLSYKAAGVDIDAGDALVERIKPLAKRTMREGVLGGIGGFGALFEIPKRYKEPVLVSGTDGVGTKLKLAFEWNMHDTVGIDLVAMSVNDVLVQGAEPLFFLDYFACGKLDVDTAAAVIGGIAKGCELSGCALIGGETAEMPGMYPAGEYDLAGFCVGAAEKAKLLPRPDVKAGDVILGLASSGVHSNGFSLVRSCIERTCGAGVERDESKMPATLDGKPYKEALMMPTRLYVKNVLAALAQHNIKALAHITGGGLIENIPRVLPEGVAAQLKKGSWPQTELFAWLQKTAGIDDYEMNRTFNNGIGMIVVVDALDAVAVSATLSGLGEQVHVIGQMVARTSDAVVIA